MAEDKMVLQLNLTKFNSKITVLKVLHVVFFVKSSEIGDEKP